MEVTLVTITEIIDNGRYVRFVATDGRSGRGGINWFPNAQVGQVWKLTIKDGRIIDHERVQ